ncbi:16518_t:CDS:2, partial [Acaulospora morrowiae]
ISIFLVRANSTYPNHESLIGKEAVKIFKVESELPSYHPYPESEFIDGSRSAKNNKAVGTMENDRLAEKLNDPEEHAKI